MLAQRAARLKEEALLSWKDHDRVDKTLDVGLYVGTK